MELSQKQKNKLKKIAKEHGLNLILLFGSVVNGKTHKKSDIDIAVRYQSVAGQSDKLDDILDISRKLMKVFNGDVDVSIINRANPLLLKQINENCRLLYGRARDFNAFRLYAFHRFNDYLPFFKLESEFAKKQTVILNK